MENEEIPIENSEDWFVFLQRVVLEGMKTNGSRLYVKHKVGKQYMLFATLSLDVDTNSRQFKSAIELMKAVILNNEETLEDK